MNRRNFLTTVIQALLLALFPWLRTRAGVVVAGEAAEAMVPIAATMGYGSWCHAVTSRLMRDYNLVWTDRLPARAGPVVSSEA